MTTGGDEAEESDESEPEPVEEARRPRTTPLVSILELEQCAQSHPARLLYGQNQHTKFVVCRLCRHHANYQLDVELVTHLEQEKEQVVRRRQRRARRRKKRRQRPLHRKPRKKTNARMGEASHPGPVVTHRPPK